MAGAVNRIIIRVYCCMRNGYDLAALRENNNIKVSHLHDLPQVLPPMAQSINDKMDMPWIIPDEMDASSLL